MVNYPFDYVAIFEDNAGYLHGFFSTGSKWVVYLPITEKGFTLPEVGAMLLMTDHSEVTALERNPSVIREHYNSITLANRGRSYYIGAIMAPSILLSEENMGLEGKRWFGVED